MDLSSQLSALRNGSIDINQFRKWVVSQSSELSENIAPGILLKLKRGDMQSVMKVTPRLLSNCKSCEKVFRAGEFESVYEFDVCKSAIDLACESNTFEIITKPEWFNEFDWHAGADLYLKCLACSSIWSLLAPERSHRGYWKRIA